MSEVTVPKKTNLKFFIFGLMGVVTLGLLVAVGVGVYRAYAQTASDGFTLAVARLLRLPAAKVNGQSITYLQYAEDMRAIRQFRAAQGGEAEVTDEALSDQVILRLASNILVAEAAERYNVSVEEKDMEEAVEALLLNKNEAYATETDAQKRPALREQALRQVNSELQTLYGWSLDEYRWRVLKFLVLVKKVEEKIQQDPPLRQESKNKAVEVLAQIKAGADFSALAAQYGTDGTASRGGDLGWFSKGRMVPEFEQAVFGLKKGELSEVVESRFGYHIIKLVDKRTVKNKDAKGKIISQEEVQASHILFRPDMQKYLDSALLSSNYYLYIRVPDPIAALKDRLPKKTS